ncbi:MAG: hypothetical protein J0M12_05485 [Deltaproteobacteria bacterium]|nr:hypothetical protein [Deltaproteobacteria bacterium]
MDPSFEQEIPLLYLVIGFVVLFFSGNFLRGKLRQRHLRREGQIETKNGQIASIEERVAANGAWASGEIRSKGAMLVGGVWLLAVVWNLTFGVSFIKQFSNPEIKTGGLVVLGIFALLGLPIVAFAIRVTLRHFRYGESLCRIVGKAGVLGQGIKGNIFTKTEVAPDGDYTVMLQCVESYTVGSGKNQRSKTEIHWHGKQTVSRGTSSRAGIPFSIDIPEYPPETGYQISRGQVNWQLTITAPTKGLDYAALFIVPVFKTK